jgi:hypothetical protein
LTPLRPDECGCCLYDLCWLVLVPGAGEASLLGLAGAGATGAAAEWLVPVLVPAPCCQSSQLVLVLAMWVLVLIAVDLFWQSACMGGWSAGRRA